MVHLGYYCEKCEDKCPSTKVLWSLFPLALGLYLCSQVVTWVGKTDAYHNSEAMVFYAALLMSPATCCYCWNKRIESNCHILLHPATLCGLVITALGVFTLQGFGYELAPGAAVIKVESGISVTEVGAIINKDLTMDNSLGLKVSERRAFKFNDGYVIVNKRMCYGNIRSYKGYGTKKNDQKKGKIGRVCPVVKTFEDAKAIHNYTASVEDTNDLTSEPRIEDCNKIVGWFGWIPDSVMANEEDVLNPFVRAYCETEHLCAEIDPIRYAFSKNEINEEGQNLNGENGRPAMDDPSIFNKCETANKGLPLLRMLITTQETIDDHSATYKGYLYLSIVCYLALGFYHLVVYPCMYEREKETTKKKDNTAALAAVGVQMQNRAI